MNRSQLVGHLSMLAFSGLVAGSFSLGARVANDIAPDALTAVRFWLAALVLGAAAAAVGGLHRRTFQAPWRFGILGGLFVAYFVLMFEGLKTAPPVSAAAVFTLTPLMAAGFGWLVLRQKLTSRIALALFFGAMGAVWVIFRADLNALLQFRIGRGEGVYFIGCAAHALYIPLVRKLNRGEGAIEFAFATTVAGAILLTAWAWPNLMAIDWSTLPPLVWITLAYIVLIATAVTFVLLQIGSMRLPSAKVMAYTYLTPSWVIMWELALGGQVPPLLVILGLGLTLTALGLLLRDDG
ncbi:DMT family transporter [Flavimaricola marinus]|uniref:EamA-like transporter family protein n=1 Tax=Flavimaricola marinus TaxID=1819565 RepID=A0A238LBC4_9RHOB|nr:DMT family transporter [Flavimaricola marinus]SMY06220.1 EamA-like transporter family protein [Flavimaricola marinus]